MKYLRALTNSSAYKIITQDVAENKLSHAYLVTSNDEEIIKSFFALCGCIIFCRDNVCLECDNCRKVINHNHSDIRHIAPEDNKQLKVEQIKEMVESTYMSAIESTRQKLYFIYNGERMNHSAQNKLLKTLEEPPKGVTIFIGTTSEAGILDTVKSRSRKIYIDSLSSDSIILELSSIYGRSDKIINAANACCGNIGIAERLINDESYQDSYDEVFRLLIELNASREILEWLSRPFLSKDRLDDTLSIMQMVLRDCLVRHEGNNIFAVHKNRELDIIVDKYTPRAIVGILDTITIAKEKLQSNCNAVNVVDSLLFSILEVRYKCRKS